MTLDLEPAFDEPGSYEAVLYPPVAISYSYTIHGDFDGTVFRDTFDCKLAGEAQPAQDNSIVILSDGVTRKVSQADSVALNQDLIYHSLKSTCPIMRFSN